MSSDERRTEPTGGEPALANDQPAGPVAPAPPPAASGDPGAEASPARPPSQDLESKPHRPVSTLLSTSQPSATVDDYAPIATVADATGANRNGSANAPPSNGSTAERIKAWWRTGHDPGYVPNGKGKNRDAGTSSDAAIFDPGRVSSAPAVVDQDVEPRIEPEVESAADAVVESPIAESVAQDLSARPEPEPVVVETNDADVDANASSRPRRKPLFAGRLQRHREPPTEPSGVAPSPPAAATTNWILDDLPAPLAPPPLLPADPPDVTVTGPVRSRHAFAPTALQPHVPDFPATTRMIPATTSVGDNGYPNYVDPDLDEPPPGPTFKRPVSTTAATGRRRPRIRRVTRVIRHVDPWSVFKVALCFSIVLYGVCLTAAVLLWNVAYTTGTIDNIERFFESFGWDRFEFKGGELYHNAWIAGLFASVGLVGFIVLAVTLFNLITDLVGGIRVTVLEEEVVERDPAMQRPRLRRRVITRPVIDPFDPDAPLDSIDATNDSVVEPVPVEPTRHLLR